MNCMILQCLSWMRSVVKCNIRESPGLYCWSDCLIETFAAAAATLHQIFKVDSIKNFQTLNLILFIRTHHKCPLGLWMIKWLNPRRDVHQADIFSDCSGYCLKSEIIHGSGVVLCSCTVNLDYLDLVTIPQTCLWPIWSD